MSWTFQVQNPEPAHIQEKKIWSMDCCGENLSVIEIYREFISFYGVYLFLLLFECGYSFYILIFCDTNIPCWSVLFLQKVLLFSNYLFCLSNYVGYRIVYILIKRHNVQR